MSKSIIADEKVIDSAISSLNREIASLVLRNVLIPAIKEAIAIEKEINNKLN